MSQRQSGVLANFWIVVSLWLVAPSVATLGDCRADDVNELLAGESVQRLLITYCLDCHASEAAEGQLEIDALLRQPLASQSGAWEKIVKKLTTRQMPPLGAARPTDAECDAVVAALASQLDHVARIRPNPGRTETFRRLNRSEYRNAVRDLLCLKADEALLPPNDESSHGFDNVTVVTLSPMLLERYVAAAQQISRLALGTRAEPDAEHVYRARPDVTQDAHLPGSPIGLRGGIVVQHYFPLSGDYEFEIRLMRDRNEELEGRPGEYQLEVTIDRERVGGFTFERPRNGAPDKEVDAHLKQRIHVEAGQHDLCAAFLPTTASTLETIRQPLNVHYNYYRHPRIEPAVFQLTLRGPIGQGAVGDTPSRRRVLRHRPADEADEAACEECAA
ncbi:MAG: DUF1587 domain-containing protein, partial [Planctomycetales bacterium]|nr:DUF1587 domain-containing protein [Planctomycetales bacterium]